MLCGRVDAEEVKLIFAFKEIMTWLIIKKWHSDFNFYI